MTQRTTTSPWSSDDLTSFISSITMPRTNNESTASIERLLSQKLQAEFNLGQDADLQLYADLSHAFIRWRIRQDNKSNEEFGYLRHSNNGNEAFVSSLRGQSCINQSQRSKSDVNNEEDDSDLSIDSHHSSESFSGTKSFPKDSKRNKKNGGRNRGIYVAGSLSQDAAIDSDLEADYLSANDSSDIEYMRDHDDDDEDERLKVVDKMSSMKLDPETKTSETTPNSVNINENNHSSNNLLKEFELMGRHLQRDKENEEPMQQQSSFASEHFTSSFRNININTDDTKKSHNDAIGKSDKHTTTPRQQSSKNTNDSPPKTKLEIPSNGQENNTTTTPITEPKQNGYGDFSFGCEIPSFGDESDSDLFTPGNKKQKEPDDKQQANDDEAFTTSNNQQQQQQQSQTEQQPAQPFNLSSSIFNGGLDGNEFKFNVDLRSSKSITRRGSPRSRRSRFKRGIKKANSSSSQNTESSRIHFDIPPTTQTTPTANSTKAESPKTMDIDTPRTSPTPPTVTTDNFDGRAFTIGTGGISSSKKGTHHRRNRSSVKAKSASGSILRDSIKAKAATPEKRATSKVQPKFMSSYEDLQQETKIKEFQKKFQSIRNEAKSLYSNENYAESVLKFTDAIIFLTDNFNNIPKPTKNPEKSETLASTYGNRAAALMMVGAYGAASSDCAKGIAHLQGFNPLAMKVENQADLMSYFKPDGGLILMSKLSARMCRAYMKLGNVTEAEQAIKETIRISDIAAKCHQKILTYASEKGLCVPDETMKSSEKVLVHCRNNATLNKNDLHTIKERIEAINRIGGVVKDTEIRLARKRSNDIYPKVEEILKIAPANIEMQESKVLCLASLRKWPELISYCESLGHSFSSANAVYVADLKSFDPFPDLSSNTTFNITTGRQLNAKEVAYLAKWIPRGIVAPLYLRALRLEERYLEASKACEALASLSVSDEPVWSPDHKREKRLSQMIEKELQKINRTMFMKEEGDKFFRDGNYRKAADMYASVLLVDGNKISFLAQEPWECETAGGRLHAVLHCNRAACLMALKQFEDAAKECSAAIRIHKRYMKALLRRARCYARIERFEESISEYNRWSGMVQEARANPYAKIDDECMFDRACDVSGTDHASVMAELSEVMKMKSAKEEKERQAAENARRRASSAYDRRQQYYNDFEGGTGPRRWDPFNGSSPKKDTKKSTRASSFRSNQGSFRSNHNTRNQSRSNFSNNRQSQRDVERPSPSSSTVTCHYSVLQVNSTASLSDIKKSYHRLALKYHPDKNKTEGAAEIFRKVKLAYETLSDDRQRRMYDVERLRSRRF